MHGAERTIAVSKPIYVIGHRNPDTDSICSAIAYAHLKAALGEQVVAARAGKINLETQFVLDYFEVSAPELIVDMYPRARDIMHEQVIVLHPGDTLQELGQIIKKHNVKSVPIVDDNHKLVGMVTVGDLAERYVNELEMQDLREAGVDFAGILRSLAGTLVCGQDISKQIDGQVRIAAARTQTMVQIIKAGDVVLVGDRIRAQLTCIEIGVACLIISGNTEVSASVLAAAQARGTYIICSPYDTYTCARLINQSIPVSMVMKKNVVAFSVDELVADIKGEMIRTGYRGYPVIDNGKVVGVIHRDRLIVFERDKIILVDHNEGSQAVEGIEEAQIVEIVDHHRLGGLETSEPIFIRHEPVGSTATIVANMHWHRNVTITKTMAGLLLAAILSDTVLFKSPTTTASDQETAAKLAAVSGLDMQEFGMAMLKAGSVTGKLTPADILASDLKEFQIGEYRVAISQIAVMEPEAVLARKIELWPALQQICEQEEYDMGILLITGILEEASYLIFYGQPSAIIIQAFGAVPVDEVWHLPGVMSRKKQVVPPLIEAARRLK
jgi:manganese-dependent inorganic pyrophosphatase